MNGFDDQTEVPWYGQRNEIKNIIIKSGVENIGSRAFQSVKASNVTIPDSVRSIGDYAFMSCSSLQSIEIPNSVKTMAKILQSKML